MIRSSALSRFLEPIGASLTPELARRIADYRADDETGTRLDDLGSKANDGTLTPSERDEYAAFVHAIDMIGVLQAKARAFLRHQSVEV